MSANGPQSARPVSMFPGALCPSLMITYRVGVPVKPSYDVVELVEDSFEQADYEEGQGLKFLQSAAQTMALMHLISAAAIFVSELHQTISSTFPGPFAAV